MTDTPYSTSVNQSRGSALDRVNAAEVQISKLQAHINTLAERIAFLENALGTSVPQAAPAPVSNPYQSVSFG